MSSINKDHPQTKSFSSRPVCVAAMNFFNIGKATHLEQNFQITREQRWPGKELKVFGLVVCSLVTLQCFRVFRDYQTGLMEVIIK